jgi:trimethylamine--corrinoid protein Co-methyltransferase
MRTTNMSLGALENTLIGAACVEVGHDLGLPVHNSALSTDAKHPGIQAGYEKGLKVLPAALVGADIISGGFGALENSNTFYLPMVPIDAEIAAMVRRLTAEVDVGDESLMLEVTERVGVGGNYLKEKVTRERVRAGELFMPEIASRLAYDQWAMEGRVETDAARDKVEAALTARAGRGPYLTDDQRAELSAICGVEGGPPTPKAPRSAGRA